MSLSKVSYTDQLFRSIRKAVISVNNGSHCLGIGSSKLFYWLQRSSFANHAARTGGIFTNSVLGELPPPPQADNNAALTAVNKMVLILIFFNMKTPCNGIFKKGLACERTYFPS
ncbi:hypothetical protein ACFPVS_04205 [Neisseria weixii]|uniref:hypothetical protein n=1 Tax=Neisseria weixii TaxID=1853276 RepID=UPI000F502E5D|nr:hypothetical protein [Neisseria weixii]